MVTNPNALLKIVFLSATLLLLLQVISGEEGKLMFPSNNPLSASLKKNSNALNRMITEATNAQASKFSTCYGCIIDAGSSGSRVYVYSWDCRTKQTIPNIKILQTAPNFNQKPGIAKLAKPYNTTVTPYLGTLVTFAKGYVPSNQTEYTPIYFSATAGMRLLNSDDSASILQSVASVLSQSGFYFETSFASVITGVHEGVFGWLTVNYVQNRIAANTKTTAVLDLGGASFQVTFNPTTKPTSENFLLNLANVYEYNLYSHSFLGYGNDEARYSVLRLIPRPTPGVIVSPCFNNGFNETGALATEPTVRVIGSGDPAACRTLIRQFLNVTNGNTINGVSWTSIPSDMDFIGMSSVGYLIDYWGINNTLTVGDMLTKGNAFCQKDYSAITSNTYKSTYCFLSMYSYELLSTAFKLSDSNVITATNTINSFSITYAFGNLMYYVSLLPCNLSFENCVATVVSAASGNGVSILFTLLLSICLLFVKFNK